MNAGALATHHAYGFVAAFWAYARHELLYLSWAVMEVALLAPLALAVMPWTVFWAPVAFAFWLLLVMLIPFNLSRLLTLHQVPVPQQRKIMISALLLAILISLRGLLYETRGLFDLSWLADLYRHFVEPANPLWGRDLTVFLLVLFLWWRGLSLTSRPVDIKDVGLRLRVSSLLILPLVVAITSLSGTPVFAFVLFYFFVSLVAVSLTRAEEIALDSTGHSFSLRARWLGAISLTSLALVSVAALLALAISGQGLDQLISWTSPVWVGLRFFTTTLVSTVSYLAFYLLSPLIWLMGRLFDWLGLLKLLPPPAGETDEPPIDRDALLQQLWTGPGQPALWANRIVVALSIAALLFLAYIAVSRFMSNRRMALQSEERPGTKQAGDRTLGLGLRLRKRLRFWQQWRAATSVRRIYREMSALAADYGFPRAAAQTPHEYQHALAELWPEGQGESKLITRAYVRVRYGELPESDEELAELRRAWEYLRMLPPPEE
jgi:hypothetical protein